MKVCVYAICKNEMEWVDRWLDNMSPADYIVVLDTGSTDGTYEYLQKDPRVTRVEQKIITPWRFDVARNESMKLVPDDADVLVCTDFDELFEEGWCDVIRNNWKAPYNRMQYTYAWSHNSIGEPQDVFKYDKIHTREFEWKFPVHEVLWPINDKVDVQFLDVGEAIYLHHFQDMKKERKYYFDLLELSVKENPEESHCRMLLAREYFANENYEKALEEYKKVLEYDDVHLPERRLILLETLGRCGDLSYMTNEIADAIYYYHEFLKLDYTYREPYFCLAEIYNQEGLPTLAEAMVNAGLKYSIQKYDWVERKDNWIAKDKDILGVAAYNLGRYEESAKYTREALNHDPKNFRLMKNYAAALESQVAELKENN